MKKTKFRVCENCKRFFPRLIIDSQQEEEGAVRLIKGRTEDLAVEVICQCGGDLRTFYIQGDIEELILEAFNQQAEIYNFKGRPIISKGKFDNREELTKYASSLLLKSRKSPKV